MATNAGTQEFEAVEQEINQVLQDYGNTLILTSVSISDDTDLDGEFIETLGTPTEFSGVTYDTFTLQKDFGNSLTLNNGESALLVSKDVTFGENDRITFKNDTQEFTVVSISPLKTADVLIAQALIIKLK